jgi:hypothetical protein
MPTRFYLHNAAAPYTPATIRGAWSQTTGAVIGALDSAKAGGGKLTSKTIAETSTTNPFDVLIGRWVSGPLAAQTISGTLNVTLGIQENNLSADINWHIHVYVTQGDSDTPRGTLLTDYTEALGVNEWPTTQTFKQLNAAQTLASLAISAGDRVVIEVGYTARNAVATSFSGTVWYGTQDQNLLTVIATDGTSGGSGTAVSSQVGHVDFSVALTEAATLGVRVTQAPIEVLSAGTANTTNVNVSQFVLEVISRNQPPVADPSGGGTSTVGIDPGVDSTLCGQETPIVWVEVETDAGTKVYAKTGVALDGTFKEARLLAISNIDRAISDQSGRFTTSHMTVTLADMDRVLRGLAASGTLLNKRVDVYVASAAQLRAAATPRRIASMQIRDFTPQPDLTFTLELEDQMGATLGEFGAPLLVPQRLFTLADFPNLPAALIGQSVPIAYGLLSDEALGGTAIGVVPCIYVGARRLSDGKDWDEYVVCGHAVAAVQSWFASDLSDVAVYDPASGGHGPRPTKMSTDTEGSEFLIPGHAGWTSVLGANSYRDYNGNRYTVIYATGQRSKDAINGDVPMSINIGGIESNGDGTGTMIDSLPRQVAHLISNFILQNYTSGAWSIPVVNGYTRVSTSTFETVKTASEARVSGGYLGAFLLGAGGSQQTIAETLSRLCQDGDFDLLVNRHGQICASMVYPLNPIVKAFTDVTDIAKQSFSVRRKFEYLVNRITYHYQKNFIPDSRPWSARTGAGWYSDITGTPPTASNSSSITAVRETRTLDLPMSSLRSMATAVNVVDSLLGRRAFGPIYSAFQTGLCGLDVELGDLITVTHFAGMDASGWTNKKLRVERIAVDLDKLTVELEGQAV